MSHPFGNEYGCECEDCQTSEHPCAGECGECKGCFNAYKEDEETKYEIDSQTGRT